MSLALLTHTLCNIFVQNIVLLNFVNDQIVSYFTSTEHMSLLNSTNLIADEIEGKLNSIESVYKTNVAVGSADTKNSVGLVGCIEEVAHNAIAVYWNPLESSAKVREKCHCGGVPAPRQSARAPNDMRLCLVGPCS